MSATVVRSFTVMDVNEKPTFTLEMPSNAPVLSVGKHRHNGWIRLWALVDIDAPSESRTFLAVITEEDLPETLLPAPPPDSTWCWVGTCQNECRAYHVFAALKGS